jgi:hypothetical protein
MAAVRGVTLARKIFLAIVCACLVGACGQSSPSSTPSTSFNSSAAQSPTGASSAATSAAATAPAAVSGCGTYCQQAGFSQGGPIHGYPCPKAGCLRCPPQNCVSLASGGATATNGVATVKLSCNLSTACHGALLICLPMDVCSSGRTEGGFGGRLAGSDFVVPPKNTREVGVALTTLGKQVASGPGGFRAMVVVDLLDYGMLLYPGSATGNFSLTSTSPPTFPAGATASCGGPVFVGPHTSCPFAENVEKAYLNSGNATVSAVSPVTGQTYVIQCVGGSPDVCRGGTNALVEFYH